MRAGRWLRLGVFALAIGGACGGGTAVPKDGGGGIGGNAGVGGVGGADGGLVGCLETPGALDRPPSGRLPCELIPPGLRG
jgi:hypothetical protein